jgi:26S proteasome regulatory subunit N10
MAEALMVVLDNSAFMINGDYEPSRWGAQIDATSVLLASRSNINVENAAGLATMAGPSVDVLCTPTTDNARVSACLSEAKVWGCIHFVEALKICALILKNRQNTNLRQRIFMFVGSAIQEQLEELRVIGRKLNKHQIAVSIAAFGDISAEQRAKLDGFIQTVSQEDNSTVTYIAAGLSVCDHLLDTPVFMGGIDSRFPPGIEAEDPELRMALEMSMKEEEERRKREAAAAVAVAKEAVPHSEKMEVEGPKDPPKPRRDEFDLTE